MAYCLRLFASIDLVGSTAFKQKSFRDPFDAKGHGEWRVLTWKFYREAAQRFEDLWAQTRGRTSAGPLDDAEGPSRPRIWKTLGDEILFVAEIGTAGELARVATAFVDTVAGLSRQRPVPDLDYKGTMWLAEFPGLNATVPLRPRQGADDADGGTDDPSQSDFLGPAIDLGFRLGKLSSVGVLPIDLQTALFLSEDAVAPSIAERFIYLGRHTLKGINQDRPYPVFALDTEGSRDASAIDRAERLLDGRIRRPERANVHDFCARYLRGHFTRELPFLAGSHVSAGVPGWIAAWTRAEAERRDRLAREDAQLRPVADPTTDEAPTSTLSAADLVAGLQTPVD